MRSVHPRGPRARRVYVFNNLVSFDKKVTIMFILQVIGYAVLILSCYLHKIYQGYVLANPPPPTGQKLMMVFSYRIHIFSCYLHIKMPGEGGILPCYLHRRYRSIFQKKSLRSKLSWCFYLSYQMCTAYITIYLHINYRVSFHIYLPQWLKLPRCLYLNYQVYGVNVIVLFTEITGGRVQQIYSQ